MSEKKRIKKSVFIDDLLNDQIDDKFRKDDSFSFQSVGEDLTKAWVDAGMPYPARLSMANPSEDTIYAVKLLEWLRNPPNPDFNTFTKFVLAEFERQTMGKVDPMYEITRKHGK